jgi:quercetin dioxygenase-like cupin family protein
LRSGDTTITPATPSDQHDSPQERGFAVAHARDANWTDGLRGFFAYRDLGVATATGGRVGAHVIRARGASTEPGETHRHTLEFQLVYVLRGWVEFDYDGVGRVRLETGSSVVQPPGIHHAELAHSEDLEMLEITLPAHFETEPVG